MKYSTPPCSMYFEYGLKPVLLLYSLFLFFLGKKGKKEPFVVHLGIQ